MDPVITIERPEIPEEIIGERILLRRWQREDAPALFEIIQESRARLGAWMFWIEDHAELAHTEEFLLYSVTNWMTRRELGLAITDRFSSRILGSSGFHNINWKVPSLETGYWIRDGEEGNGYVTEAVLLQMELAFNVLNVQRLAITCDPLNTRSRAIPERLGFRLEGHMRNHMRTLNGRLRDTLIFAMTPEEYQARLIN